MKFTEVTKDQIKEGRVKKEKRKQNELKNDLIEFLGTKYEYAIVEDDYYNNNNDLRRAIQHCVETNDLPIAVFMKNGITYIERL